MERVDCVVIGAGVVGLAMARQLALAGREVIVLEAAGMIGTETSSRNSEVIHAGIYYPTGSLKARLCVAGKHRLYAYCAEHGVPHRRCGKLIVATTRGADPDARGRSAPRPRRTASTISSWLSPRAGRRRSSRRCSARGALLSPSTGIIDSHA